MSIFKFLRNGRNKNSASLAKERLQIIISHERSSQPHNDLLKMMENESVQVIAKYLHVDQDKVKQHVKVDLDRQKDHSVLELNITLPEVEELAMAETEETA